MACLSSGDYRHLDDQARRCGNGFADLSFLLQSLPPCSAGELNSDELERIVQILQNPQEFKIPNWFLNRQKDIVDGKSFQLLSNNVDSKLRDDIERLKKIRAHRGIRHYWGLRVRGVSIANLTAASRQSILLTSSFLLSTFSNTRARRVAVAAQLPTRKSNGDHVILITLFFPCAT